MAYKLIEEFKRELMGGPSYAIRAPLSPLLLAFSWSTKEDPLSILCINKGRDTLLAVNENSYFEMARRKFRRYYEGDVTLKELQHAYDELTRNVDQFYDQTITLDLKKMPADELCALMKEIDSLFIELVEATIYTETIDEEKMLAIIGQKDKLVLDEIWELATHPTFLSFEARRLKDLLDIAKRNSQNAIREAKYIFTDYSWTKSETEIGSHLKDFQVRSSDYEEKYAKFVNEAARRKSEFDAWFETLGEKSRSIAAFIQLVMHLRDLRKDLLAKLQAIMCVVSVEMLSRVGIDEKYAPLILLYEYMKGVEYLKDNQDNIVERVNGFISFARANATFGIELCDFDKAVAEFEDLENRKKVSFLKGQIANKGKVTGRVKVVLDPHDAKDFEDGDVLVTSMTRPEFLSLMKRASAFVTNEGGVTCHAAIVAREMNKPCIIGARVATSVLKDGDMVEVDAENGVVNIVNF